jgi:hypothetical protein
LQGSFGGLFKVDLGGEGGMKVPLILWKERPDKPLLEHLEDSILLLKFIQAWQEELIRKILIKGQQ